MTKANRYHRFHMRCAAECADMSHAEKKRVGCIIVSPLGNIIGHGWNGMPAGHPNQCEFIDNKSERFTPGGESLMCGSVRTRPEVLHAEENAIGKCAAMGLATRGAVLYVTHIPCVRCARLIWRAGILTVYYMAGYDGRNGHEKDGTELLRKTGVALVLLDMDYAPVLTPALESFNTDLESTPV